MTKATDKKARVKPGFFCVWNFTFVCTRRFRITVSDQTFGTLLGVFPTAQQQLTGVRFGDLDTPRLAGSSALLSSKRRDR